MSRGFTEVERSEAERVELGARVFGYLPASSHLVVVPADAGEAGFVEGLGIYDRTVTYDAIDSLGSGPATFVDIAGDVEVRRAVHSHYGDRLVHSMTVGVTHWEELAAGAGELPGPTPTFFFAPDRVTKRSEDWGRAGLETRVADAWRPFCEWTGGWLETIPGQGFGAVRDAYFDVLEGRVDPAYPHVLTLST